MVKKVVFLDHFTVNPIKSAGFLGPLMYDPCHLLLANARFPLNQDGDVILAGFLDEGQKVRRDDTSFQDFLVFHRLARRWIKNYLKVNVQFCRH